MLQQQPENRRGAVLLVGRWLSVVLITVLLGALVDARATMVSVFLEGLNMSGFQ